VAVSSQALGGFVAVECGEVDQEQVVAAGGGLLHVGVEAVEGVQGQGGVGGVVAQVGQAGSDVFEAFHVVQAAGLEGGFGLADQGDPGVGRLGALPRCEDVERGLLNRETFISRRGGTLDLLRMGIEMPPGTVAFEDPPSHTIHRKLLSRMFTANRVSELEPDVGAHRGPAVARLQGPAR